MQWLQMHLLCATLTAVICMKSKLKGTAALLVTTVIWGSAFTAQSVGMDYIGPFTFQAVRCCLAVLFLFPVSFVLEQEKAAFWGKWRDRKLWKAGLPAGIALFMAGGLQQMGLIYTTASKAGFLFKSTEQIKKDNPSLEAYEEYDDLYNAIVDAL